jgi:hypothetical protein
MSLLADFSGASTINGSSFFRVRNELERARKKGVGLKGR